MQHLLRVIPVIGILTNKKEFNPTPNAAEVEAVFDAPLEMFLKVSCLPILPFFALKHIVSFRLRVVYGRMSSTG